MFSTCRSLQTGLILLVLSACSKEAPAPTPGTPLVAAPQTQGTPAPADTLSSHINAAGIAATYAATFGTEQQVRIVEQRADSRNGEYEFRGARLLHYSGNGLSSADPIELRFDLQGVLTLSKAGAGAVPAEEVSAIRERAQLLRSHALAQKTSRDHH
ncbi:MAG TPA: hypothetical protein VGQ22_05245 [Steroidobacteraceae bacterium]|jgi:hypothetical protein|nr:hypothetical protein [Steroidobacteraceae bacterium]